MVIAFVTFPQPVSGDEDPRTLLAAAAPEYQAVPGLRRKYFIGDGERAGGVYEWADRAAAERYFDDAWRGRMRERYGVEPRVALFDAPCLVDNVCGEVLWSD